MLYIRYVFLSFISWTLSCMVFSIFVKHLRVTPMFFMPVDVQISLWITVWCLYCIYMRDIIFKVGQERTVNDILAKNFLSFSPLNDTSRKKKKDTPESQCWRINGVEPTRKNVKSPLKEGRFSRYSCSHNSLLSSV